jgi:uncharacterized protein YktA (UPF0223 family)
MEEKTSICPKCKETVMENADICKHCRYDLLSYRKTAERIIVNKTVKEAFKNRLVSIRKKLSKVYSLLLLPILVYLIVALVILPIIRNKQNEERVIAGVCSYLSFFQLMPIEVGKDPSDPVLQNLTKYIDDGYFPNFGAIYAPIRQRTFMKIYNSYKNLIPSNSPQKQFVENVLNYDDAHGLDAIKSESFMKEMEKAKANWVCH